MFLFNHLHTKQGSIGEVSKSGNVRESSFVPDGRSTDSGQVLVRKIVSGG